MEFESVITGTNITKKYKGFKLDVPFINIPKGLSTALIGENGAGKTTLLNILAGIRLDFKGDIKYFDEHIGIEEGDIRERIGYTGTTSYFLPHWTIKQVEEVSEMLFSKFDSSQYEKLCKELCIWDKSSKKSNKVSSLSDGNKIKLMLASVLARDTNLLILDEPASPLDPLMREKLSEMIHDYIYNGKGENSVFFSTHNISDMENVTDYAIIMENGKIVEQGFVEDLKEKYIMVKGELKDAEQAKNIMYSFSKNHYGFEGVCLADNMNKLAGMDVVCEVPTLFQISVAVMKANTTIKLDS